jgi:hypothetical protein
LHRRKLSLAVARRTQPKCPLLDENRPNTLTIVKSQFDPERTSNTGDCDAVEGIAQSDALMLLLDRLEKCFHLCGRHQMVNSFGTGPCRRRSFSIDSGWLGIGSNLADTAEGPSVLPAASRASICHPGITEHCHPLHAARSVTRQTVKLAFTRFDNSMRLLNAAITGGA